MMKRWSSLRSVVVAALASVAVSCVAPRSSPSSPPHSLRPEASEPSDLSDRVLKAHNVKRAKGGLPPFFSNPRLETAASGHALDMATRLKMAHRGGDGSSPFDRIERQGYRYRGAGENVAYGFDDVEAVMTGWMKSAGHRRNILGPYIEIGVGRAIAKDGASYWCVTFGTPLDR